MPEMEFDPSKKNNDCISELNIVDILDKYKNEFDTLAEKCYTKPEITKISDEFSHFYSRMTQELLDNKTTLNNITSAIKDSSHMMSESVTATGTVTVKVLEKINTTISSVPDGSYALAFTSGILGAISAATAAFSLNYFYWKKLNEYNRLSHFAGVSIKHLNDFENYALSYWTSNANNTTSESMIKLEIKIRTQYSILKSSLEELCKKIPKKHKADAEMIITTIEDIFDDATGGNFESASKVRDRKLALKIARKCLNIKTILIKYTQKMGG
ncbi:TPA: hypothetical protein ACGGR7_002111 [Vibrio cholerae]